MLRLESDLVPYLHGLRDGPLARDAARRSGATRRRSAWCWPPRAIPSAPRPAARSAAPKQDFGRDVVVFHAGTQARRDGVLRAAGGRVLNVCARGADLPRRATRPTRRSRRSTSPDGFYRTDIGWRAL